MRQANKTIKQILKKGNVKINIKGVNEYKRGKDGEYGYHPKNIRVTNYKSIHHADNIVGGGMNIEKFGREHMYLFSYDLVDNRTHAKIRYTDIEILD